MAFPTIIIHASCSVSEPGTPYATAGIGVFHEPRYLRENNLSEQVPLYLPQTNQAAELWAMIRAVQNMPLTVRGSKLLLIKTNCKTAVLAVNTWYPDWVANGWKTSAGGPVANKDLILQLWDLVSGRGVILRFEDSAFAGDAHLQARGLAQQAARRTRSTKSEDSV